MILKKKRLTAIADDEPREGKKEIQDLNEKVLINFL